MSVTTYYANDPNNDPSYNYNFDNMANSNVDVFQGNGAEQILYNLMSNMRNVNNNIMAVPAFFEALIALGNNPNSQGNTEIQTLLAQLNGPDSTSGTNTSAMDQFANLFVTQWFCENGGDLTKTQANITDVLAHIGGSDSNPIYGPLRQALEKYQSGGASNPSLLAVQANYTELDSSGVYQLGYYSGIGANKHFVRCPAGDADGYALLNDHLSGVMGNWFNGSNLKDTLKDLRLHMFDEVRTQFGANFFLLAMFVSMMNGNDDSLATNGLANNAAWESHMTSEVSDLVSTFNPAQFTNDNTGEANANAWMAKLQHIQNELDNQSNADGLSAAETPINGLFNQQVIVMNGKTMSLKDIWTGQGTDMWPTDLALALNELSANPGAPANAFPVPGAITNPPANETADNNTALSKAFTSISQTTTTKNGALAQVQNQMNTLLSQVLTAEKKLLDAILAAIGQG